MLYHRTAPTRSESVYLGKAFLSLRKETLRECAFGEELSWPRRRRALLCLRTSVPTGDRVSCLKRLAAIREPIAPRPENPAFCSCLLLPPRVAHHVLLLCGSFRLHHFDGDLAKMRAAGPGNGRRRPTDRGKKLLSRTGTYLDCSSAAT